MSPGAAGAAYPMSGGLEEAVGSTRVGATRDVPDEFLRYEPRVVAAEFRVGDQRLEDAVDRCVRVRRPAAVS